MAFTNQRSLVLIRFYASVRRNTPFILCALSLVVCAFASATDKTLPFALTPEEQVWLSQHPVVTYTGDPAWLPYEAFDKKGQHIGIVSDLLDNLERKIGVVFKRIPTTSWEDAVELALSGEIDMISEGVNSQNFNGTHTFSKVFLSGPIVIFTANPSIGHIDDIGTILDKRIGFVDKYSYTWKLRDTYPHADFIAVKDVSEGVAMAVDGRLDYFLSHYGAGRFYAMVAGVDNFTMVGQLPVNLELAFAVRSDLTPLVSIINKAILSEPVEKGRNLSESWFIENSGYVKDIQFNRTLRQAAYSGLLVLAFIVVFAWGWYRYNQRHHARYQMALAQVQAGEFEYNPRTQKLFVSRFFMQGVGIHHPPTNLSSLLNIVSDSDRTALRDTLDMSHKPNVNPDIEFNLQHSQGKHYLLRLRGQWQTHLGWRRENVLVGTIEDVTSLRESQADAERQKRFLRSVIDSIPDAVFIRDWSSNSYILVNKSLADFMGLTVEDVTGVTDAQLLARDPNHQFTIDRDNDVLRTQKTIRSEAIWYSDVYKKEVVFDSIKVPMTEQADGVNGVLTIARDISAYREVVKKLEQFSLFAEQSPIGLGMTSPERLFTYCNHSLVDMLLGKQGKMEQLVGKDFTYFYTQSSNQFLRESMFPLLLKKGYWEGELDLLVVENRVIPTRQAFHLVRDDKGGIRFICGMAVDISNERQIRQELAESKQKAEQANQSKSVFLANMSHEIRTPLNAIIGFSQLLSRDTSMPPGPLAQIQIIETAGRRLLTLINDILDLSKIEAGKLSLSEDAFDIKNELEDVFELLKVRAQEKGLSTFCDIDLGHQFTVIGDRLKVSQIVLNILSNAIKFTFRGSVSLLAYWNETGHLVIKVLDTGEGINNTETDAIFQPFTQGTVGEQAGGTGLGLPLSKQMAELMGGSLTLTNRDDTESGVEVIVTLPLKKCEAWQQQYKERLSVAQLSDNVVLTAVVVEDDHSSRELIVGYLKSIGVTVIAQCLDGQEALDALVEQVPDVVFTDIRMPNVSGIELLKQLRANPTYQAVKIVAVTASSLEHQRDYFLAEGFDDIIGKPIDFGNINRVLDAMFVLQWDDEDNPHPLPNTAELPVIADMTVTQCKAALGEAESIAAALTMGDIDQVSELLSPWHSHVAMRAVAKQLEHWISQYDLTRADSLIGKVILELRNREE